MRKHLKRLLSMLLVLTMVTSFVVTGWAVDEAGGSAPRGTELEMEDLDPGTLHIPKLGEVTDGEESAARPATISPDEIVRVSIFLNEPAVLDAGYSMRGVGTNAAAKNYRENLRTRQANVTAAIERATGTQLDVEWNMTLAVNAISANVRYADIPLIEKTDGVKSVVLENRYEAPAPEADEPNTASTSENMVGACDAWELGYTGAGSRIAIIDTGIDANHQSFADEPFTYSVGQAGASSELMTVNDISAVLSQLNAKQKMSSVTAALLNGSRTKIVYGFNYVDGDTRIDHQDSGSNHGSHVAGIAAANRYIGSAHNDAASTVGAVGMAPDAQLLVMKVFGTSGGAYDSDYMVAIEDAIMLDCDAVNLSLGSGQPGFSFSDTYQGILNGLVNKTHNEGMVVSISAGNSYDAVRFAQSGNLYWDDVNYHTGGSPGSFINSLCVAAAQNTLTTGTPLMFNNTQQVFYSESTEDGDGNTYTNPKMTTIAGSYNYVYIDAVGNPADFSAVNGAVSLSGKIVIVNRGDLSFSEKGNNASSYSPKGMIVANNAEGTILMNLADYTGTFPMVSITLKDAEGIKAASTSATVSGITYYTGSVEVTTTEVSTVADRSDATITDFSSWGVPGSLLMKPEITAPGGDIYSVNGTSSSDSGSGTDQYISYSGTSMAAPHITGLSAVVAEYLRENPMADVNADLAADYSTRAIIQSLLMSTATPMIVENAYLPILQQGAGLAEVSKAVTATSVIMMTDEGNTLTVRTGAIADGKVKAELGDDPDRAGEYSFGFTIYNLTDKTQTYELDTDLFTQAIRGEYLARSTDILPSGGVTYTWNGEAAVSNESHDVNKDGKTDNDDVQAILDFAAGLLDEEDIDVEAADMDGDEMITSYDAYLLIDWAPQGGGSVEGYTVAPHGKAEVVVTIKLTAAQKEFLADYVNGAYLEGFTYVTSDDGTEHTIPVLGFYGSWTDPSMFDTMSYVDSLYGANRSNYSGNQTTNYLRVNYAGTTAMFSGNPYMVEEEFPADRLAINSNTTLMDIGYNLVRSAGTTGYAVTKLDGDGNVTDIVTSTVTGSNVTGLWYYVNQSSWQNTTTRIYSINKTPAAYGLSAGDRFRVGFYAIPEYNGMVVNNSYDAADSAVLDKSGFDTLLMSNVLGYGAMVGYDFTVDNEAPEISSAALNGNTLSVTASDNLNLAYVAVLSLDGTVKYAEAAPGTNTYTVSFDASDAIANAAGYVAAFAGDYAGNETAVAVKVNNNTHVEKTVYVLTNTLEAGHDYVISEANAAGTGHVLSYTAGSWSNTVTATEVSIKAGTADTGNKPFIETADVPTTGVWTASSGIKLMNGSNYLRHSSTTSNTLNISTTNTYNSWTYNTTGTYANTMQVDSRYLRYYNNTFSLNTANNKTYIYVKTTISYEVDPYSVSGVTVTPAELDLYKGNTADLTAKVVPLTASDRTVSWSSSNTSVATVDQNGHVTAVAAGTATITAMSNADNTKKGTCTVNVVAINKALNAIVWDEEGGVYFSSFNANNLPTWTKLHNTAASKTLHSAFMQSTSALYAGTLEGSSLATTLYTVNRSSYALTEVGENFVGAMDITRGLTSSTYASYAGMVYCYGPYIVAGNYSSSSVSLNDGSTFTGTGIPYGMLDASETTGAYIAGVAAKSVGTSSSTYYLLDENGVIWTTSLALNSAQNGFDFSTPTKVMETGISCSFTYQTLYYDGTYLYWGHQADNIAELIVMDPSTGKVYHAGDFGDGIWPVVGMYVNGSTAPASTGDEEQVDLSGLRPLVTRDELMTAEVMERMAAEAARFAPASAQPVSGGLNTVGTVQPVKPEADEINDLSDPTVGEGSVTIDLIETVAAHNGIYTVEYDPDVITYVKTTSNVGFFAINEDLEKGIITFAFANKTDIAANDPIATVEFSASCVETEITSITMEINDQFELSDNFGKVVTVDHNWGAPTYEWTKEGNDWTCTATRVCQKDSSHVETETVTATAVTTEATCEADGETVYTATFTNEAFETQTKTETTPATGHSWGEPTYEWAADNSTVTATRVCANDPAHVETETVNTTSEVTKPATCEAMGETTYTATFTNTAFATQTKTVADVPATGHSWGEPTYEWAADNSTVTATRVCANDPAHVETEVAYTTQQTTAASCDEPGEVTYTATFTNPAFATQTKTVVTEAVGHDWGVPTYVWADDNSTCTAERVCKRDSSHVETETVDTGYTVIKEPTTTEEGIGLYTAVFTNQAFETQTKEVIIDKLPIEGYYIIVTDYTAGNAATSIDAETLYSGEVTFTVTCEQPCLAAVVTGENTYTVLTCTTEGSTHSFTVTVTDADVTLVIAVKGDANLDGTRDAKDATFAAQAMAGKRTLTALQQLVMDGNGDGEFDAKDATFAAQVEAGKKEYQW